jgi:murein DD-endopeptidase MepM/ murein hydrolase activator NlpD
MIAQNAWGRRFRGVRPQSLQDYEVFGTSVLAPCSGEVSAIQSGYKDFDGAHSELTHPVGNGVALHCHGATVVLAHLQEGSVSVNKGQTVHAGDLLGRAGNSGNTTEPHLHIHAVQGRVTDPQQILFDGVAVPLRFEPGKRWAVRGTRL